MEGTRGIPKSSQVDRVQIEPAGDFHFIRGIAMSASRSEERTNDEEEEEEEEEDTGDAGCARIENHLPPLIETNGLRASVCSIVSCRLVRRKFLRLTVLF